MDKVWKWDGTTFGKLVRGLRSQDHWPEGMIEPLEEAVQTRNYLAHHFLRSYFMVTASEKIKEQATSRLASVSVLLIDADPTGDSPSQDAEQAPRARRPKSNVTSSV
jgi:hypothetical protein